MKEKNILPTLEFLGWRCDKDEVGDYFCLMDIGPVKVQIIPTIRRRSGHFRVSFMPSISTNSFTETAEFIFGCSWGFEPIIVCSEAPRKIINFTLDEVIEISRETLIWVHEQDLEGGLNAFRKLATDSKGARPLRHLTALAIAGDFERIISYRNSFQQGDRLGFVEYVSSEMLERALLVARSFQKQTDSE